jgi:hypothetical protein
VALGKRREREAAAHGRRRESEEDKGLLAILFLIATVTSC